MGVVAYGGIVNEDVHDIRPSQSPPTSNPGGGNGGGIDACLRSLELQVARIDERIIGLEKAIATKARVLAGVVGGMVLATTAAIALLKLFPKPMAYLASHSLSESQFSAISFLRKHAMLLMRWYFPTLDQERIRHIRNRTAGPSVRGRMPSSGDPIPRGRTHHAVGCAVRNPVSERAGSRAID